MRTAIPNTYVSGRPNLDIIRSVFPQHGEGDLEHIVLLGDKFRFHIQRNAQAKYEILIKETPSYRGRPSDIHSTHRHDVGTSRERICIKEEAMPRDLPTAVALAMWWAECTSRYIADGHAWAGGSR